MFEPSQAIKEEETFVLCNVNVNVLAYTAENEQENWIEK